MLERFAWKKASLANCRCPVCGDSQTSRSKARGYFFVKGNTYLYKCHNCSHGSNLYNFIMRLAPELAKEYKTELWIETNGGSSIGTEPPQAIIEIAKESVPDFSKDPMFELQCVEELSRTHIARKYVESRKIPKEKWGDIYYTTDFGSFARQLDSSYGIKTKDKRLVLPFFNDSGELIGAAGRILSIENEKAIKYITIKSKKHTGRLWYNLWNIDPSNIVYVVEGPIDSLFLDNCVAMSGMASDLEIPDKIKDSKLVFVLDNEPRNSQVCNHMEHLIQNDQLVCIWPESLQHKDINEMVLEYDSDWVEKIVKSNTFGGIEALFKLNIWRKI